MPSDPETDDLAKPLIATRSCAALLLPTLLLALSAGCALPSGSRGDASPTDQTDGADEDKAIVAELKRLYDREHDMIVRRDFAGLERFMPADFVVTNPFNQFIDKPTVMERLRADIIKYSSYTRQYDAFRVYGDTVIVVGSETVVPAPDANRPDAGQTVHRRFTEVWLRRDGQWQKVARHANNAPGR
jgi:hypothetical protein